MASAGRFGEGGNDADPGEELAVSAGVGGSEGGGKKSQVRMQTEHDTSEHLGMRRESK